MNRGKLALLLGMLCGDGCLTEVTKSFRGYKNYVTAFFNSKEELMISFKNLLLEVFEAKGNYYPDIRENKKLTYAFRCYSRDVFDKIADLGFPIGLKKYKLRIPEVILKGSREEKLLFLKGLTITDGSIKKGGQIVFHMSSKLFLEDVSDLIYELFDLRKNIREYLQKEKYFSYQLLLNKEPSQEVLSCQL